MSSGSSESTEYRSNNMTKSWTIRVVGVRSVADTLALERLLLLTTNMARMSEELSVDIATVTLLDGSRIIVSPETWQTTYEIHLPSKL